ncbi:hypothetical protein GSI_09823 [Ganoderma sinense ZZ0214-1]|uniref:Uncharacterized protein n=1 Tax=Ganoderma sinense ZZ0214-1 TaxID=1077348 RepID=A0A2G8S2R8_9APHY|nr:hypothetical protein GSI_09823 [Ganoderma sinense ZZ0214-1]
MSMPCLSYTGVPSHHSTSSLDCRAHLTWQPDRPFSFSRLSFGVNVPARLLCVAAFLESSVVTPRAEPHTLSNI